ncbi:SgrR family transcriptional regulator [Paenibacillus sp. FSL R7-0331]|uniref:SgrR family transcriptional regulator n=1 Tax=Paenibacillus sp. FSL R7-0331 TaxID=1536773 RepID=UPI0004F6C2BB|nr:SgrR family transcriptional regulator [Paenibacillus sp. FSL R7-0331]AIQ52712.1 hypothetical protein R70331_15110 [Paenibacillus sp. FSL R7-0331]
MDIEEYYLQLKKRFEAQADGEWFPVTIDELALVFDCTRRNAQFLIQKLREQHFIGWKSGLGRGNSSQLALLRNKEELILARAQSLSQKGQLSEAFACIQTSERESVHAEFHTWLGNRFGVQKERSEQDILRYPFYRPVPDLDPMKVIRRTEAHIISQLFDTLTQYDPSGKRLKPGLAHHWEHDGAFTRWTFYLRKGVLFHHGKPFKAEDVQYTFDRIREWNGEDWLINSLQSVEVTSSYSVSFELRERNALFAYFIAAERFSIVPADLEQLEARHDYARLPVGTGPFSMRINTESMLIMEANEHYFAGRPFLDAVEMWVWPDYEEELRHTQPSGQPQLLYFEAMDKGEAKQTLNQLEAGSTVLTFNLSKPGILQDYSLRNAIHLALSREQMIRELKGRRNKPSSGFHPGYYEAVYGSDASIAAARISLEHSTYNGEALQLYTYEYFSNEEDARWIMAACSQIGVQIELTVLTIRELSQAEMILQADMIYAGEVLGDQPVITLIEMYRSQHGYIRNHLHAPLRAKVDAMLADALTETGEDKQLNVLRAVEEELKQQLNVLFLYHSVQEVGYDLSLHGISLNAWGKINYKDVWVK